MVNIIVSNEIIIKNLDYKLISIIKKVMTIPNPTFFLMKNMGKRTWIEPDFKYYKQNVSDNSLIIPRGSLTRLKNFLDKQKVEYTIDVNLIKKELHWSKDLKEDIKEIVLRPYQESIVESVVNKLPSEGIISMTTGSGKTLTSLAIIQKLGLTATIIVKNNTLLNQWVEDFRKQWNYEPGVVNGEKQIMRNITLATYQTLNSPKRKNELKFLSENTSVLFIEECQGVVSKTRMKVVNSFKPLYLFGLTGTPDRTDKQTEAIFFYCGNIIEEFNEQLLAPTVECTNPGVNIPVRLNYNEMVDEMVESKSRNKLIWALTIGEMTEGRKILILTKRVAHSKNIFDFYSDTTKGVYIIDSKDKERHKLLRELKEGERDFNIILGTTSLLAEGTDVPSLDTLIIASDMKSSVLTTQSVGRILRLFSGKQPPKILDLQDMSNPIFRKQAFSRLTLYRSKGWIK